MFTKNHSERENFSIYQDDPDSTKHIKQSHKTVPRGGVINNTKQRLIDSRIWI